MSKSDTDKSPTVVMAELLKVVTPQVERVEESFKVIRVTLDALADHLRETPESPDTAASRESSEPTEAASPEPAAAVEPPTPVSAAPPAPPPVAEPVPAAQPAPTAQPVPTPRDAPSRAAPPRAAVPASAGDGGNWSQIVFGDHLGTIPGLSAVSGELLADVYAGDNDAIGLLGQLLTFRAASGERKPKLLKEMGEAFYLWKPTGEPTLRDALIAWIHALLEEVGIANRIEIVQAGDRYDLTRHNSRERGVEIGDVYGWCVLRENGKVYSKASVAAK
jgi:hypothetical protein